MSKSVDAYAADGRRADARTAYRRYLELRPESKSAAYARERLAALDAEG